jgi:hypothetical protein
LVLRLASQQQSRFRRNSDKIPSFSACGSIGGQIHSGLGHFRTAIRALGAGRGLKEIRMKRTVTALCAAAALATATASVPTTAEARCVGCVVGAGIAGFAAGAIVGSAIANAGPAYVVAPPPGYVAYPAYYAGLPGPNCFWTRRPVYDYYGNVVGWRGRPVAVCQ